MIKNTSYKVQVDVDTDAIRNQYNIEEGAYVTTETGVYSVYNGEWVRLFPQYPTSQALGWARYDDGQYTSANKLSLADGVTINLPNNANNIVRSNVGFDYYNSTTQRVTADNVNDTYVMTVVFKCSAANANQTHLDLQFEGENGTPYDRIRGEVNFSKGNDIEHDYHGLFQYYADSNFVNNGSYWQITATGGTAKIWDIIYFIQKTQSYA
jgi:hypothetical protein